MKHQREESSKTRKKDTFIATGTPSTAKHKSEQISSSSNSIPSTSPPLISPKPSLPSRPEVLQAIDDINSVISSVEHEISDLQAEIVAQDRSFSQVNKALAMGGDALLAEDILRSNRAIAVRTDDEALGQIRTILNVYSSQASQTTTDILSKIVESEYKRLAENSSRISKAIIESRNERIRNEFVAREKYKAVALKWRTKLSAIENKDKKSKQEPEKEDEEQQQRKIVRAAGSESARRADAAKRVTRSNGNSKADAAEEGRAPRVFRTRSGKIIGMTDTVSTEADFKEVLEILNEQAEQNPVTYYRRQACPIPRMLTNEESMFTFVDNNRFVVDPEKEDREARNRSAWTESERETFKRLFAKAGKNFRRIADHIPTKTIEDLVEYYYRNKYALCSKKHKLHLQHCVSTSSSTSSTFPNPSISPSPINANQTQPTSTAISPSPLFSSSSTTTTTTKHTKKRETPSVKPSTSPFETAPAHTRAEKISSAEQSQDNNDSAGEIAPLEFWSWSTPKRNDFITSLLGNVWGSNKTFKFLHWTDVPLQTGDWTQNERKLFLEAVEIYGRNYQYLSEHVRTRSYYQCRQFFAANRKKLQLDLISPNPNNSSNNSSVSRPIPIKMEPIIVEKQQQQQQQEEEQEQENEHEQEDENEGEQDNTMDDGIWTNEEEEAFVTSLSENGKDWKLLNGAVQNKTMAQLKIFYKANHERLKLDAIVNARKKQRIRLAAAARKKARSAEKELFSPSASSTNSNPNKRKLELNNAEEEEEEVSDIAEDSVVFDNNGEPIPPPLSPGSPPIILPSNGVQQSTSTSLMEFAQQQMQQMETNGDNNEVELAPLRFESPAVVSVQNTVIPSITSLINPPFKQEQELTLPPTNQENK